MPSLRERPRDIPILAEHLVRRLAQKHQQRVGAIPRSVIDTLLAYDWPGNVRELENVLERAIIAMPDSTLRLLEALTPEATEGVPDAPTTLMRDVEQTHILRVLHTSAWRIEGPRGAALPSASNRARSEAACASSVCGGRTSSPGRSTPLRWLELRSCPLV
jgi:DNA-binding NtrC family response regulator